MRPNEVATVLLGVVLWHVLAYAWWGPVAFWLSLAGTVWLVGGAFLWWLVAGARNGPPR